MKSHYTSIIAFTGIFFSMLAAQNEVLAKETVPSDTVSVQRLDTTHIKGSVSISGLVQSGNENRFVASLLSELIVGNSKYQVLPITSLAYSSKPHAQVEGEYLENIIIRLQQNHLFYPAAGLSFEKSFLRKIDYRLSAGITVVCNVLNKELQSIKLGIGLNYELTQYVPGAFLPLTAAHENYSKHLDQVYVRLKGKNHLLKNALILSYDFFYQPDINDFNDYRWTLIGNMDIPLNKRFAFRTSAVDSYENFVATYVHNNNFRLTFGLSWTI